MSAISVTQLAAILRVKLRHLDDDNEKRNRLAAEYSRLLAGLTIEIPAVRQHTTHVYHLYVIKSKNRDVILKCLKAHDINAGIHYPVPIHLQPAYRRRIRIASSMDVTERIASKVLSLPMYPELTTSSVNSVTAMIRSNL